jgi:phospholipase C
MKRFRLHVMAVAMVAGAFALSMTGVASASSSRPPASRLTTTAMCGTKTTAPAYKHVVVIMEENRSYASIYHSSYAPYINSVIKACGLATNYHNITHPSLPNYIAFTSGLPLSSLRPFLPDCSPSSSCEVPANTPNIFSEVASKGGWKSYEESMPSPCYKSNSGDYAPRHNPAVYYTGISAANCKAHDIPLGTTSNSPLLKNFSKQSTAPAFSFVTPNVMDDMHNGTVKEGDNWLKTWLPLITKTPVYESGNTVIFITWDEGEGGTYIPGENCVTSTSSDCHVVTVVIAPSVKKGRTSNTFFTHYSILKTAELLLGVPRTGRATTANSMKSAFNL